jgi:hypothetical protein
VKKGELNRAQKNIKERKMKEMESIVEMLPYLVPIFVLELALLAYALIDLFKRKHITGGKKIVWVLVAVCFQIVGPIAYLVFGRKEPAVESDQY